MLGSLGVWSGGSSVSALARARWLVGGLGVSAKPTAAQPENCENNRVDVAMLGGGGACVAFKAMDVGMASHWWTVAGE